MANTNPNNVTPIESKRPAPPATHTISYVLDGFPVTTQLETTAGIREVVDRLKQLGAEPPAPQILQTPASAEPTKATAPNACPEHGKAKPSKKPGHVYCPTSLPDGGYCQWTGKA